VPLVGSIAIEEVLLLLKIVFLVLLYLFIWRIVRTASRDLRAPQESFILAPQRLGTLEPGPDFGKPPPPRLVVVESPALEAGKSQPFDAGRVTIGRTRDNDLPIGADRYASGHHARFEPRPDGVWVTDLGSTNGTFVNGARLSEPRRLEPGDVVRVGETDLRFER